VAVRFRPFTGTSRGFPSADDVGGRRQESDVTELDRTGDPDSAGRHAAPGGDGAEGHTQVIWLRNASDIRAFLRGLPAERIHSNVETTSSA